MNKKRIVLVLGAGASKSFNQEMGLGADLIKDIANRVYEPSGEKYLSDVMLAAGFQECDLRHFREDLEIYMKESEQKKSAYSIDDFIQLKSGKKNYLAIAKLMIMLHVLGYERPCENKNSFNKPSWLTILCELLNAHNIFNNDQNKLEFNIVTFNYDRLVEEFLFRHNGGIVEDFCNNNIHHVYGKVSHLPWQHEILKKYVGSGKPLPFIHFAHPNYDQERIKIYTTGINLIYEGERGNDYASKYHILNADVVLFMGFGFDENNLELLGIKNMREEENQLKKWHGLFLKDDNKWSEISGKFFFNKLNADHSGDCQKFIENTLKSVFNNL